MQTYNNCGPTSVAILLAYYDHWVTQQDVNEVIPIGLNPCALSEYLAPFDLMARYYANPSRIWVQRLLANGIPVIVGQQLSMQENIGHYRVFQGYDDDAEEFLVDDPLRAIGQDYHMPYSVFSWLSRRGGVIVPIYPPEMDDLVQRLMRGRVERHSYCPTTPTPTPTRRPSLAP